ncbi:MAG: hypothetical protein JW703_00440 [Candidatus Diapherotrites archaeon]|nr:hypothetical protein [Candidatus Diapherotrites archaeon]
MKGEQIMALFIVILMIGSIVGFAVWSSEDRNPEPQNQIQEPFVPTNSIKFTAESVPVKVINTFNYLIITANTNEMEINKIDSEIKSVNGVKQISSRFAGDVKDSLSSGMMYIAEITFSAGKNPEELVQEIQAKAVSLTNVQGILNAVVNVPKTVTLSNSDLNLIKEHEFAETRTQALVLPSTIEGDELLVSLEVSLANSLVTSQTAFEEKNITAEPIPVMLEKELDLNELKPELALIATINRSFFEGNDKTNELIKSVSGITGSNTILARQGNMIKVYFNELNETEFSDLNNSLNEITGINVDSDLNKATVFIQVNAETEYNSVLNSVEEKISLAEMDFNSLVEPTVSINSDINIESVNSKEIAEAVNALLEGKEFEVQIMQKALFSVDKLVNENDESFEVTAPIEAMINPGKTIGEKVNLSIYFYGIRGKAEYLQAEEVMEE